MNKFLLLLGPSGVGKSTIIRGLREEDNRFVYISPYITRPLRDGEKDKVSVSGVVMNEMASRGEFLVINELYGVRYATPRRPIFVALDTGKFPILDWPIQKMDVMTETFPDRLYRVYVFPPSLEELKPRIDKDGRDVDGHRIRIATEEIKGFQSGQFDGLIDLKIESTHEHLKDIGKLIYTRYLESIGEIGLTKAQRI